MELLISGTFKEILSLNLWDTIQLCKLLRIDPYKLCMVDTDKEVFTITEKDIVRFNRRS